MAVQQSVEDTNTMMFFNPHVFTPNLLHCDVLCPFRDYSDFHWCSAEHFLLPANLRSHTLLFVFGLSLLVSSEASQHLS